MLTLIWCPFHPRVTAVGRKRPRSFRQKCRWQVTPKHAHTLTQRRPTGLTMPLSRHSVGTYPENDLTRNLSSIRPQSSQLAEPLWTDPGIKEWNLCARANLHLKKKSAGGAGNKWSNIVQKSSQARKERPTHHY